MVALDAPTLVGVVYSTVGRADAVPPRNPPAMENGARNLKEVCRYA
jgi:hypothetical protein